jgi:hypothetical protein
MWVLERVMSIDKEREAFEAWCNENYLFDTCNFIPDENEKAKCKEENVAWRAWQARAKQDSGEAVAYALVERVKRLNGEVQHDNF